MTPFDLLKYPVVIGSAALLSLALTPAVRSWAERMGVVDHPSDRRLNDRPVARSGGVAVFVAFHVAAALLFLTPWHPESSLLTPAWWGSFLVASTIMLAVGLVDDVHSLSPKAKLAGQTVAALVAFAFGIRFDGIFGADLPWLVDLVATLLWILAITNAFNLIDGLDGLASGLALIAGLGMGGAMLFQQQTGDALVYFALSAACLGFLRYNFHPASVFLGDAGSLFLGFALACLALGTSSKTTAVAALGVPLLAVGVPVLDTLLAIWRRSVRWWALESEGVKAENGLMSADMDHVHHRLLRSGLSQRGSAAALYGVAAVLVGVGLLSLIFQSRQVGIFLIAFLAGTYVVIKHLARVELWDTGRVIVRGLARPPDRALATITYPIADVLILQIALGVAVVLANAGAGADELKAAMLHAMPLWVGLPTIVLVAAQTYERTWSRARLVDFFFLTAGLGVGIALSCGSSLLFDDRPASVAVVQAVVQFGIAFPLLLASRTYHRIVEDLMALADQRQMQPDERVKPRNILLYGAGHRCMLYLRAMSHHAGDVPLTHLVGLIDDDANLRKMLVFGYRVLGSLEDVPEVLDANPVDEIVLTANLDPANRRKLIAMAEERRIMVSEWRPEKRVHVNAHRFSSGTRPKTPVAPRVPRPRPEERDPPKQRRRWPFRLG